MNDLAATLARIDRLKAKLAEWENWSDTVPHTAACDAWADMNGSDCTCPLASMPEKRATS